MMSESKFKRKSNAFVANEMSGLRAVKIRERKCLELTDLDSELKGNSSTRILFQNVDKRVNCQVQDKK
jgi:hypothetical protein